MAVAKANHAAEPDARKARLLVLTSTYPRWQGDHEPGFVHELAKRLTDRFEVHVLAPHAPGASRREIVDGVKVCRYRYAPGRLETLVNDGGIVANLRRQRWKWLLVPGFFLSLAFYTLHQLRRLQPDVVHAHWLIPQGLIMALLSLVYRTPPFLVTSHGADLFTLRSRPMIVLKRLIARRAGGLTVVSQAMAEELQRINVEPQKISIQPMGVDLQFRFTPNHSMERSRNEILFVGRLVEKKGLRYLIAAMPEILEHHPDAFLTIAGYGPEADRLRKQVGDLGVAAKVNFLGAVRQDRLPTLYRRAAVFVAPFVEATSGDQEGFGLVAAEAIGCRCPVLVGDVLAVRDVVPLPHRRISPKDPKALGRAVNDLLAKNAEDRAIDDEMLRQHALLKVDWSSVANAYAECLISLHCKNFLTNE